MKKKKLDELRPEYKFDYTKAERGKYYKRLLESETNVVVLDSDVAKTFQDSDSVNQALRGLLDLTRSTQRLTELSKNKNKSQNVFLKKK